MAKWGEGDPRWIVEERPDATNVNNWHWVERNATMWSKEKLRNLFEGLNIEDDNVLCKITELSKIEGEAMANNRKGKLIFFYEWVIEAQWEGQLKAGTDVIKGTVDIPNLSEEHDAEDVDVTISTKSGSDEAYIVKEFVRVSGTSKIREQMVTYIRTLKEEFGQGALLPTKTTSDRTQVKISINKASGSGVKEEFNKMTVNNGASSSPKSGKMQVKKLCKTEDFKCSCAELFNALTYPEMIQAYAGHDSVVESREGGTFSLFGGNITGYFTQLVPEQKIATKWRFKSWPKEHFSDVIITLSKSDDGTKLVLQQNNIPESDFEQTIEGWSQNYWGRIRTVFGFGARIY